jgi:hypothetical protein
MTTYYLPPTVTRHLPRVASYLSRSTHSLPYLPRTACYYLRATGNPDNPFNKPKVNLGPAALAFRPARECSRAAATASPPAPGLTIDGAELAIEEALALYGGRFRRERTA